MGATPEDISDPSEQEELLAGLMVEHGWRPWEIDRLTEEQWGLLVGWLVGRSKAQESRYGRH